MKLWFVDDKPKNHETWFCSFSEGIKASCEIRTFLTIDELFGEFSSGILPDVLFVDFFVGERLGTEVIKWFANRNMRPVLIAHSSMEQANTGMVAAGADFPIEKIKDMPFTSAIRKALSNLDDLIYAIENRRIRQCPEQIVAHGSAGRGVCAVNFVRRCPLNGKRSVIDNGKY